MYPISVNIQGKRCVVVGGGKVAERRVTGLREQGAQVVLVAPDATPALRALTESGDITWCRENYRNELLDGAFLVIAATDQRGVNAAVARDALARNLLVCSADGYEDGNFTTPGVVRRGDLVLTVTTGGKSPTLAALLREKLAGDFSPEWAELTTLLGRLRGKVQGRGDEAARRQALQRIINDQELHQMLEQGRSLDAEARAECLLSSSE